MPAPRPAPAIKSAPRPAQVRAFLAQRDPDTRTPREAYAEADDGLRFTSRHDDHSAESAANRTRRLLMIAEAEWMRLANLGAEATAFRARARPATPELEEAWRLRKATRRAASALRKKWITRLPRGFPDARYEPPDVEECYKLDRIIRRTLRAIVKAHNACRRFRELARQFLGD